MRYVTLRQTFSGQALSPIVQKRQKRSAQRRASERIRARGAAGVGAANMEIILAALDSLQGSGGGKESKGGSSGKINTIQLVSFCSWKGAWGYNMGTLNILILYYTEVMGMSVGILSLVMSLAKFFDLGAGFVVGMLSDGLKSQFGKRRPFIFVGGILCGTCVFFLGNPPASMSMKAAEPVEEKSAADAGPKVTHCAAELSSSNCSSVKVCLTNLIAKGTLEGTTLGKADGWVPPGGARRILRNLKAEEPAQITAPTEDTKKSSEKDDTPDEGESAEAPAP
eukprot:6053928-Prymnesium_polylepis.1